MSGPWRKVEGEYVDRPGTVPFETPEDALDLTVPNKLPTIGTPAQAMPLAPRPLVENYDVPASPPRPKLVRVRVRPRSQHIHDLPQDINYRLPIHWSDSGGLSVWSYLGFTGLIGSALIAYSLYRNRQPQSTQQTNETVRYEWIVDRFGTLHRAQVRVNCDSDEQSEYY